ncbi:MAG: hypothetical protein AB7U73_17385 [Pirellulales bacterium]
MHWFRFKLSTVLILTAIAAWAMTMLVRLPVLVLTSPTTADYVEIDHFGDSKGVERMRQQFPGWQPSIERRLVIGARMIQPALALVAFLAWKAAWAAIARRRRTRPDGAEVNSQAAQAPGTRVRAKGCSTPMSPEGAIGFLRGLMGGLSPPWGYLALEGHRSWRADLQGLPPLAIDWGRVAAHG